MIRLVKQCRVCKQIKEESKGKKVSELQTRIYRSYEQGRKLGDETLMSIYRDYATRFSYQSLMNHAKYHQALTANDLIEMKITKVARENQVSTIQGLIKHQDLRQAIMDAAAELLKSGELKGITAGTALKAAKDAADVEAKQTDQAIELQKMVMAFAAEDRTAIRSIDVSGSEDPELPQRAS